MTTLLCQPYNSFKKHDILIISSKHLQQALLEVADLLPNIFINRSCCSFMLYRVEKCLNITSITITDSNNKKNHDKGIGNTGLLLLRKQESSTTIYLIKKAHTPEGTWHANNSIHVILAMTVTFINYDIKNQTYKTVKRVIPNLTPALVKCSNGLQRQVATEAASSM